MTTHSHQFMKPSGQALPDVMTAVRAKQPERSERVVHPYQDQTVDTIDELKTTSTSEIGER